MKNALILVIMVMIVLCGCEYSAEPDERAFVTAIGFDKGTEYPLRMTFIFTSPSMKNADPESGGKHDETVVIEAPSIYSAIEEMKSFMSKRVDLAHTQTVIFSEELAKDGIEEHIYELVRSNNFRPNTYVCIADKSSMEFLEKVEPIQVNHLEKYFQLVFKNLSVSTYGDMYLYDTYFELIGDSRTSVLPYCAINDKQISVLKEESEEPSESGSNEKEESSEVPTEPETSVFPKSTDDFLTNTIAGKTITKSTNPAEILGVAIIRDGKYISVLGKIETFLSQMATNSMPGTYLTVSAPDDPDSLMTVYLTCADKTKKSVDVKGDPKIYIKVELEGDFIALGKNSHYIREPKVFEEYLEEKIKNELTKLLVKSAKELNCDICSFFETAKKEFKSIEEWEAYDWINRYPDAQFDVDIDITMRSYGELSQTA